MARRKAADKEPPLDLVIDHMREPHEDGDRLVALYGRNPRVFDQLATWETSRAVGRLDGIRVAKAKRLPQLCAKLDELGFTYQINEAIPE
jgi:hypothetical protein